MKLNWDAKETSAVVLKGQISRLKTLQWNLGGMSNSKKKLVSLMGTISLFLRLTTQF